MTERKRMKRNNRNIRITARKKREKYNKKGVKTIEGKKRIQSQSEISRKRRNMKEITR